jgi:hypothetical protein
MYGWWTAECRKERTELNSLYTLIKTSILEKVEVGIDHLIDLLGQDIIHCLQQVVTWDIPLFGGYRDEPLRDNIQVVVWEFSRSSPVNA